MEGHKFKAGLLRNARKGADETACHRGDKEMFRCPAPWLSQELGRSAERNRRQNSFRLDDAIAPARAKCFDSIFMVRFHFVLLSSCQRATSDSGPALCIQA